MKGEPYRYDKGAPLGEAESWDACVSAVLGPRLASDPAGKRKRDALHLAAAALRAAEADDLAAQAQERITV